jgi:hypothetical protein
MITVMKLHIMSKSRLFALVSALLLLAISVPPAPTAAAVPIRNVVIVHGASADGSRWSKVISLLQTRASA